MKSLQFSKWIFNLQFCEEGRSLIYTCAFENNIYIWDTTGSDEAIVTLTSHELRVSSICVLQCANEGYVL